MTPATYLACLMFLPESWHLNEATLKADPKGIHTLPRIYAFYAVTFGVWGGLIIGYTTEYYTSYEY